MESMGSEGNRIQSSSSSSGDISGGGEAKKKRFVWTVKNHSKFVQAVNLVGFDKATPKKIMLAMNMPNQLTRDIVSSHWQKYKRKLLKEAAMAEEEEHRRIIMVQQTPAENNNGLTDTEKVIMKHAETAQHLGGLGSEDHLQVSVANSSVDGISLHDHRVLSYPQSFDFAHSHHNGCSNFFGNHTGSTVAAARSEDYLAGSCLQAADRCGYGRVNSTTVESDPLEFTVVELIDNIDN